MQKHISVRTPHVTRLGVKIPLEPFYSEGFGLRSSALTCHQLPVTGCHREPGNPVKGALTPSRVLSAPHCPRPTLDIEWRTLPVARAPCTQSATKY